MCFISVTMKGLSLKKQGACPGHPATKRKTATTYSPTKRQYHRRDEA